MNIRDKETHANLFTIGKRSDGAIPTEQTQEISNEIVRAVNMHDDLIDALKSVMEYHEKDLIPVLRIAFKSLLKQAESE